MTAQRHPIAFTLIAASTALGIAGTDLVLPAVPTLPQTLGGTLEGAQLVLAAFTAGAATGLLLFGELGARFDQRRLLVISLCAYALTSLLAGLSQSLSVLVALRFAQGAAGAAAAVFAPGMLRAIYGDKGAVAAIGLLGSIESLAPALAPVLGLWLMHLFGWRATFDAIAILAALLALFVWLRRETLPVVIARRAVGGYGRLLTHGPYLRQAISHAFTLGALLVIVFGAPTVFVATLGATLSDFIVMQIVGIACFIVAANLSSRLAARFGAERVILFGTVLAAVSVLTLLGYALIDGSGTVWITALFIPFNIGFGLRGPAGFHAAIVAADDDARGAALLVVAILLTAALGTAAVAPFIASGLIAIATGAAALTVAAVVILVFGPRGPRES